MSDLKIEKMVYGGDGLARLADDSGKRAAVFVPFVLPGEEVEAQINKKGRGFSRATAEQITAASARRVEALCPYFQRCGGCHYQHTDYAHQLEIKTQILRETLLRTAKFYWQQAIPVHSGEPWNYRNRTRVKVRGGGRDFAIGYHRFASHDLLPVEECPISSPLINRALHAIWKMGRDGVVPAEIAEIEFFASAGDDEILLELYLSGESDEAGLQRFAESLQASLSELKGMTAFAQSHPSLHSVSLRMGHPGWSFGASELVYRTANASYHVRAGSFFQTNRYLADELVRMATSGEAGEIALDLYAGTGLFSLPLGRSFTKVIAVESAPASYADLRTNAPANVECHRKTTEDFLSSRKGPLPELVVVDPPRAGLGDKVTGALAKMAAARMVYVSCDPATLARDLSELLMEGYKVQSVDLIDLFPQTFHIETVVRLTR